MTMQAPTHRSEKLIDRRRLVIVGGLSALGGCAGVGPGNLPARGRQNHRGLAPLRLDPTEITQITACLRPFRPAGPRVEVEALAGRKVVHNYGHGGSGWSLAWGCAEAAAALALDGGANRIAVIGAGVIGMTTAIRLAENGVAVTVYAKEFPAETRSSRATGVWSPASRIALESAVAPDFPDRWERWARASYAEHLRYLGDAGESVAFQPQFSVPPQPRPRSVPEVRDFARLGSRLRGLTPGWRDVPTAQTPFRGDSVRGGPGLVFNISSYMERLVRDFLLRGGRMVRRTFPDAPAVLGLDAPVIVNCVGYAAKSLWDAGELSPVRGQINWLPPQPEARYSVFYGEVFAVSRRDGVAIQYLGPNEDFGFGVEDETPDRDEARRAIETLQPLFGGARPNVG